MTQANKSQVKVHYTWLSDENCITCNQPLKVNAVNKGFKICFVCFQLSKGKKFSTQITRDNNGEEISRKTTNYVEKQIQNIQKYGGACQ